MLNLYSDPGLAETYVPYPLSGGNASQSGQSLIFDAATNVDAISLPDSNADFIDRIALAGQYHISVNVANYASGDGRAKLCLGAYASLGITGDGWSTPVPITAGTVRTKTLGLFGISTGATFDIVPDPETITEENPGGEAVRITT